MSYTLIEFFKDGINAEYEVTIPDEYDKKRLGMMYFVYYCSDVEIYTDDGAYDTPYHKKEKSLHNLMNGKDWRLVLQILKDNNTQEKLKDLFWMKWYIDECDCDDPDLGDDIWEILEEYDDVVASYVWSYEVHGGEVCGALVKN